MGFQLKPQDGARFAECSFERIQGIAGLGFYRLILPFMANVMPMSGDRTTKLSAFPLTLGYGGTMANNRLA